jgi:hypothetical protein
MDKGGMAKPLGALGIMKKICVSFTKAWETYLFLKTT